MKGKLDHIEKRMTWRIANRLYRRHSILSQEAFDAFPEGQYNGSGSISSLLSIGV